MESKKLIYADDARRAILEADPKLAYCIDKVKGVDAVEVVRCKDCYFRTFDDVLNEYYCDCAYGINGAITDYTFCSYGERKDDGK